MMKDKVCFSIRKLGSEIITGRIVFNLIARGDEVISTKDTFIGDRVLMSTCMNLGYNVEDIPIINKGINAVSNLGGNSSMTFLKTRIAVLIGVRKRRDHTSLPCK